MAVQQSSATIAQHTSDHPTAPSPVCMPRLGELLMAHGLITEAQWQDALRKQTTLTPHKPIGEILVDQQAITHTQLRIWLERYLTQLQLGEVLLTAHLITESQFQEALLQQQRTGLPLGTVLLQLRYISETALKQALGLHLNIPSIDLTQIEIDRDLAKLFNKHYAQRHRIVPVSREGTTLTLAMDDPLDTEVIRELHTSTGLAIHVVTAPSMAIRQAIGSLYGDVQEAAEITQDFELMTPSSEDATGASPYTEEYRENHRVNEIVRYLITLAIHSGASDIHLDPVDQRMRVQFRLDGMLRHNALKALEADINANQLAIISRIKILGKLDIAEKRRPQDGSFRAHMVKDGRIVKIDFRISIVPGYYGESVVLRVLDPRNAPQSLEQLNFWPPITAKLNYLLKRTTGLLLITGPTGSGKSTTLYAALKKLYRPEIKVLTAENPVEYVYDEFTQCQVNEKIGNTFADYLRAFLRHDPEVIMVGEIRDEETAEMAVRAAQTGHLVLSTLHTNDAIGAIPRLLDLKIEANLITSCLLGVLSQRLVRKVCANCKEEYTPAVDLMQEFFEQPPAGIRWYKGRGCAQCNSAGYKGRMVAAELWVPSDEDIVLINKAAPFDDIKRSSYKSTLLMAQDMWEKLRDGQTNLEELIRILPYASIHQFRHIAQ